MAAQCPEETGGDNEEDRFERIEKQLEKAMKLMSSRKGGNKKGGAGSCLDHCSSDQQKSASGSLYESGSEQEE